MKAGVLGVRRDYQERHGSLLPSLRLESELLRRGRGYSPWKLKFMEISGSIIVGTYAPRPPANDQSHWSVLESPL